MGEASHARLFPCSSISICRTNVVPLVLLLPRFCYAEILGLALFILWLRWSLLSIIYCLLMFPHTHYRSFHFLSLPVREPFASSVRPDVHTSTKITSKKTQSRPDCFSFCHSWRLTSHHSHMFFLCVAISCLQLKCHNCHTNPHICYQSVVAFSQFFFPGTQWVDRQCDLHCVVLSR